MNYLTNMKNVTKLSQQELHNPGKTSWHDQYKESAWVFIGGLPFDLTEGDIICIFSQYGEVVNINLIREKDTGKSKGFCFLCYEDQRSTILAVDNLNGIKILNRLIRVDHVQNYKVPKDDKKATEETKKLYAEGCAPTPKPIVPVVLKKEVPDQGYVRETLADQIEGEIKLPARLPIYINVKHENDSDDKIVKKDKKKKKKKKCKRDSSSSSSNSKDEKKSTKRHKNKKQDSSKEKDKKKKYDKEDNIKHESKNDKDKNWIWNNYSQGRERSRSRDRDDNTIKIYRKDVMPNIPKRWQ